jgi:hypothetical protein
MNRKVRSARGAPLRFIRMVAAQVSELPTACLEWPFSTNSKGYPVIFYEGKTRVAQRILFEILAIPHTRIRHTCNTPVCMNPLHLEAINDETPRSP